MTWDRRKCSLFTVEGCSPKTNRAISPTVKYIKMAPGKSVHYNGVFTMRGFTVIRYQTITCNMTSERCGDLRDTIMFYHVLNYSTENGSIQ